MKLIKQELQILLLSKIQLNLFTKMLKKVLSLIVKLENKQKVICKSALKAALREDPDVIMVGEMRDLETVSLALTAAETGHLVFGTLHTSGAPEYNK